MPIPPSERVVFTKNPLAEVICQLRFPPILDISANPPAAFQNAIRDGYPLYERATDTPTIPNVPDQLQKIIEQLGVVSSQAIRHAFSTADGVAKVTLTSGFMAVSTQRYTDWDTFLERIKLAASTLIEVYAPAFYSRIGLRYQDIIDREALGLGNRPWRELIRPEFLSFLGVPALDSEVSSSGAEAVLALHDVDGGKVTVRSGLAKNQSDAEAPEVFLFDADFYTEERSGGLDAIARLEALHAHAGNLFRWVITDALMEALGPSR